MTPHDQLKSVIIFCSKGMKKQKRLIYVKNINKVWRKDSHMQNSDPIFPKPSRNSWGVCKYRKISKFFDLLNETKRETFIFTKQILNDA